MGKSINRQTSQGHVEGRFAIKKIKIQRGSHRITSAPIEAWKVKLYIMTDMPTDQPTDGHEGSRKFRI